MGGLNLGGLNLGSAFGAGLVILCSTLWIMPRYRQPFTHPAPALNALSSEPTKLFPEWSYMSTVDFPHLREAWVVDHGCDECQATACHALILAFRSCHCLLLPSALQAKTVICTLVSLPRPAILLSRPRSCTCKLLLPTCTDECSA